MGRNSPHDGGLGQGSPQSQSPPIASSKRSKVSIQSPKGLVIELCAGSAMLSRCFAEYGFETLAIDHAANRFHPHAKVCNLRLTEEYTWEYLKSVCHQFPISFVHAAPPCGTCCRAREQPNGPPPLRNDAWPWGFNDLSVDDAARVDAANKIYRGLAEFVQFCSSRSILWCVENPADSILWQLPPFQVLRRSAKLVKFQACMFGGRRPTWKGFLTNVPEISCMEIACNGGHEHLPFGRTRLPDGSMHYATSEEAAYPRPLCLQVVQHICTALKVPFVANPSFDATTPAVALAASSQKLPRGRKVPPVVPEFKQIITITLPELPQVCPKRCLLAPLGAIPKGAKLLSHGPHQGSDQVSNFQCTFGVYFSQDEFFWRRQKLVSTPLMQRAPFRTMPSEPCSTPW